MGFILSAYPIPCILPKEDIMKTIKEFQGQVDKVDNRLTVTSFLGMKHKAGFYDNVSYTNFMAYPASILRGSLPAKVKTARANYLPYMASIPELLRLLNLPYKASPNLSVIVVEDTLTILDRSIGTNVIQSIKDSGKPYMIVDEGTLNIPKLVATKLLSGAVASPNNFE